MIDNSYLLGLFGGSSAGFASPSLAQSARAKAQPTPPWSSTAKAPPQSDLLRAALAGRKLINEDGARLDVPGASADYRKLFALYQGLESLNALTNRAGTKGVGTTELAQLQRRFASGLGEVGGWLGTADFDGVRVVQGTISAISKSTGGVGRDSAISVTAPIHEGDPDLVSPAFTGPVAFEITARTVAGTTRVAIDLADMGTTPRSLSNVLTHINGKLEAAGVESRMGREPVKAEPRTLTVAGKTVTLPAGPDRYALVVRGVSTETIGFSAAASDAVYVVQQSGAGRELLKFQADGGAAPAAVARPGETQWAEGRAGQTPLPEGIETVRASATGPDGSVWLVADLKAGPDSQPIKGARDVALMRLDSAGRVVSTTTIGAADKASGYAISVAADGRVAVAGSVVGALEPGKTGDVATVADSFVTVFDAQGAELWTQRRGARAADEATAVVFGADGRVHVAGRAQSAMLGAAPSGGWDGYVQSFSQSQIHPLAPTVGASTGVTQFGTASDDGVSAMTVDGSDLYTAGIENGRLMLRRFDLSQGGAPVAVASRDLGAASGEVAGLMVSGGRLVVAGSTRNAELDIDTVTRAHAGETDAFVAAVDLSLTESAGDRLTYLGGAGEDGLADVKLADGKVWLTGVADRPLGAKAEDPIRAHLTRLDPLTGQVEWRREWTGVSDQATPMTLAVASGGASVLDRLGLPMGEIDQSQSKTLVDATSLRVGDRFYVSAGDGARPRAVTIEARDTLQSLARKIEQASNRKLRVTVNSETAEVALQGDALSALKAGLQRLSISARDATEGATLTAGEAGRDALAGLGLTPGYVGAASGEDVLKGFGLNLPSNLGLSTPDAIKATGERLQAAMKSVRDAYRALAPASTAPQITGQAPAYLTAQLANYQAALARLGG